MKNKAHLPLGEQLKTLRKQRYPADTQERFAVRIGVSKNTYCSMEKGSLTISMASYMRVAELYGITSRFADLFVLEESTNLFDDFVRPNKK